MVVHQDNTRKEDYIKNVVYRYITMMTTFFMGLYVASTLALVVNGVVQFVALIVWLSIFSIYIYDALASDRHIAHNFWVEDGFNEAAVGLFKVRVLGE